MVLLRLQEKPNNVISNYKLGDHASERLFVVKDLGILLGSGLSFSNCINKIIKNSFQLFGSIKKVTLCFTEKTTFVHLYVALDRAN